MIDVELLISFERLGELISVYRFFFPGSVYSVFIRPLFTILLIVCACIYTTCTVLFFSLFLLSQLSSVFFSFVLPYINTTCYIITFGCSFTSMDMDSKTFFFLQILCKRFQHHQGSQIAFCYMTWISTHNHQNLHMAWISTEN